MLAGANMLKTSKTVLKIWVLIRRSLVRVQVGEPEQEKGRMRMRPFLHFRRQSVSAPSSCSPCTCAYKTPPASLPPTR